MRLSVAAPALVLGATLWPSPSLAQPDWFSDSAGVLELKLVSEENGRTCGGLLRLDRERRRVAFDASFLPQEVACRARFDAAFEDVKSVGPADHAGFTLELAKGKNKKTTFLPLPHAEWFATQYKLAGGEMGSAVALGSAAVRGRDGDALGGGAAAGAGPATKKVELPAQVVADTRTAIEALLDALGRAKE